MKCVCDWLGRGVRCGGEWVTGLGLECVSMFGLRWCGWYCGVGGWIGSGSGSVRWCYIYVCCESVLFV